MIRELIQSLADKLKCKWPAFNVYDEFTEQGLKEPCFFISIVDSEFKKELANRYRLTVSFNVSYLNSKHDEDMRSNFSEIAFELYGLLDYLVAGGKSFGIYNVRHEVVDDVVHVFFDVSMLLFKQEAEVLMAQYELRGDIK